MRSLLLGAAAALLLAACGGGFDAPACADGEVVVRLESGGEVTEDGRGGFTSYAFINAFGDNLGTLDVSFPDGALLHLEWGDLVANGDSVPAAGHLEFGGALDIGNCETDGYTGTLAMDDDGDGGTFLLRNLRAPPYCTGLAISGELTGCFRSQP